jgi:hypothetical protein
LKVLHPTLLALDISIAITVVVFGILYMVKLYMVDTGKRGIVDAEPASKFKPKIN